MSDVPQAPYRFFGFAYPEHDVPPELAQSGQKTAGLYIVTGTFDPTSGALTLSAAAHRDLGAGNYTVSAGPVSWTDHQGTTENFSNAYEASTGKLDLFFDSQHDTSEAQGNLRVFGGGYDSYTNKITRNGSTWSADVFADSEWNAGTGNLRLTGNVDFSAGHITFLLDASLNSIPGNYEVEIWVDRPMTSVIQEVLDTPPVPFPGFAGAESAAWEWIKSNCFNNSDPRESYTNATWEPGEIPASAPPGVDAYAYEQIRIQLLREFQYRDEVYALYTSQERWIDYLYFGQGFALGDVVSQMGWPLYSTQTASLDFVKTTDFLLTFGLGKSPAAAPMVRLIWSLLQPALSYMKAQGGGSWPMQGTPTELQDQLARAVDTLKEALVAQQDLILTDWGKLEAFGDLLDPNKICWDPAAASEVLKVAQEAYRKQVFGELARAAWVLNQGPSPYPFVYGPGQHAMCDKAGIQYQTAPFGSHGTDQQWVAQVVLKSDNSKRIDDAVHMWVKHTLNIEDHRFLNLNALGLERVWYESAFPAP